MPGNTTRRYPPELQERAVRMVGEIRSDHESEGAAMAKVAELLGIGTSETVRKWVRRAEVDAGARVGTTTQESAELRLLKRENAELKRANAILKAASTFFASMPSLNMSGRGSLVSLLPWFSVVAGGLSSDVRPRPSALSVRGRGLIRAC